MELTELLNSLKRPGIGLAFKKTEEALAPNASKFGGNPYLPADFEWPYYEGDTIEDEGEYVNRPLTFLLQVNLADVAQFDTEQLLPRTGMLYFFYEYASMKWGIEPDDNGCAKVYYYDCPVEQLKETPLPDDYFDTVMDEGDELPELAVVFTKRDSVPDIYEVEDYQGLECDFDEYEEAREKALGRSREGEDCYDSSQMLGYAEIVQSSMLLDCEEMTTCVKKGVKKLKLSKAERKEMFERSKEWTLLLQLSCVSDRGDFYLDWVDGGQLYFYIRKEDLKAGNFNNIWLILQSC